MRPVTGTKCHKHLENWSFQSSLLPASEHHLHQHTLVPSLWPSWLSLSTPAGSSSIISGALSELLGFCPSQISFPTHLFNLPDTFPTNPAAGSLPTFPLVVSDTPQQISVLQQWEFVPSSVHSKEKLILQLHQGKVCEADKADTKHFFAEVLLTADVLKVCVLCLNQLVF